MTPATPGAVARAALARTPKTTRTAVATAIGRNGADSAAVRTIRLFSDRRRGRLISLVPAIWVVIGGLLGAIAVVGSLRFEWQRSFPGERIGAHPCVHGSFARRRIVVGT